MITIHNRDGQTRHFEALTHRLSYCCSSYYQFRTMQLKIVQRMRSRCSSSKDKKGEHYPSSTKTDKSTPSDDSFWGAATDKSLAKKDGKQNNKLKTKKQKSKDPKKQELPDTWYYSSNHILVNRERALNGLPQLRRCRLLDDLARFHALDMAEGSKLFHSVDGLDELKKKLGSATYAGENVQRGKSIRWMHSAMMASGKKSRDNILSKKYTEFGMGTAKGEDGKLYMTQLFRGDPSPKKAVFSRIKCRRNQNLQALNKGE